MMSLQVKFPFRGGVPLHTCSSCGFATRHRVLFERHLRRCPAAQMQAAAAAASSRGEAATASSATSRDTAPITAASSNSPGGSNSQSLPAPPVCRNYRCDKCGFATSKSRFFLYHQRDVHGVNINVYPCEACEYASKHKSKVLRHRKLVHKLPEVDMEPEEDRIVATNGEKRSQNNSSSSWLTDSSAVEDDDEEDDQDRNQAEYGSAVYGVPVVKSFKEMMGPDENQNEPVVLDSNEGAYNERQMSQYEEVAEDEVQLPEDGEVRKEMPIKMPDPTENAFNYMTLVSGSGQSTGTMFKCKLCRYTNSHKWKIAGHVRAIHMKKTLFKCPYCEFVTERKIEWCVHKTAHTSKVVYSCSECSYRTTQKRNFDRHTARHKLNGPVKCILCSYSSTGEAAIQRHMAEYHPTPDKQIAIDTIHHRPDNVKQKSHGGFTMEEPCKTSTPNALAGSAPGVLRLRNGGMQCRVCGMVARTEARLRIHMVSHTGDANWVCPICPLKYKRASDLNRHMKRKHAMRLQDYQNAGYVLQESTESPVINVPTSPPPKAAARTAEQPLNLCVKKEASDDEDDDEEMEIDEDDDDDDDDEPVAMGTDAEQPLDLSMKQDEDEMLQSKPENLKCSCCSYMAKWPSDLRRHMLVHSIEKRFRCVHCNKKYKYQFDLNMHMRKTHRVPIGKTRVGSSSSAASMRFGKEKIRADPPFTQASPPTLQIPILLPASHPHESNSSTSTSNSLAVHQSSPAIVRQLKRSQPSQSQKVIEEYYTGAVPEKLKCPYCPYIGKYRAEVERHTRLHTGAKPYRCMWCSYKSFWKGDMKRHLVKHHYSEVRKYDGDLSSILERTYLAETVEMLDDGMGSRVNTPTFGEGGSCDGSMKDGSSNMNDADDQTSLYGINSRETTPGSTTSDKSQKIVKCPLCSFICEAPSKLKCHMEIHENLKRFMCPICGKRSNWLWDVRKHIRKDHPAGSNMDVTELTEEEARSSLDEYLLTHKSPSKNASPAKEMPGFPRSRSPSRSPGPGPVKNRSGLEISNLKSEIDSLRAELDSMNSKAGVADESSDFGFAISALEAAQQEDLEGSSSQAANAANESEDGSGLTWSYNQEIHPASGLSLVNNLVSTVAAGRYRRFKCSKCGKRSNWKWDLKKHIRSTHPSAEVLELSEREAKDTFHEVFQNPPAATAQRQETSVVSKPAKSKVLSHPAPGNRFRPFKCSACGKRSNWKWDLNKHIRSFHPSAELIIMDEDEAKETFEEYDRSLKEQIQNKLSPKNQKSIKQTKTKSNNETNQVASTSNSASLKLKLQMPMMRFDAKRLKRFKCSVCPYRSNYRSDIMRHLKRKHRRFNPKVVVMDLEEAHNTLDEYMDWAKDRFKPGRKSASRDRSGNNTEDFPLEDSAEIAPEEVDMMAPDEVDGTVDEQDTPAPLEQSLRQNEVQSVATIGEKSRSRIWRCSKCDFKHSNKKWVVEHYRTHDKGSAYMCKLCGDTSDYRGSIYRHVKCRHGRCDFGNVIIETALARVNSTDNENEPPKTANVDVGYIVKCYQCKLCPSAADDEQVIHQHIREEHPEVGSQVESYVESLEKFSQSAPSPLRKLGLLSPSRKMKGASHSDGKGLKCNVCPYRSNKQGLLKIHMSYHSPQPGNKYKCQYCPYYVCAVRLLSQHERLHVKELETERSLVPPPSSAPTLMMNLPRTPISSPSKSGGKGKHFCEKCPYVSVNKNDYIYHKQFHKPKASAQFKCDFCPYWVSQRRLLTQHKKVHTLEYKLNYYPTDHLQKDSSPAGFYPSGMQHPSPCKSEVSVASGSSDLSTDEILELAHVKQQIIASKIGSVPITPEKLKFGSSAVAMTSDDSNYMKSYLVDRDGQVLNTGVYRKMQRCRHCPYSHVRAKHLALHEKMHGRTAEEGQHLFNCSHCDYAVANKRLYTEHLKVHSNQYQPAEDEVNDAEFDEDREQAEEADEVAYPDQDTYNFMMEHKKRYPEKQIIKTSLSDHLDSRKLPNQPDYYFKFDESTGDHILEKATLKKWCCEKCPYATMKRAQFERHILLHSSRQKYVCEFCDYSVPGYHLLLQHKQLHMMPNPNLLSVQSISNLQRLPQIPADIALAATKTESPTTSDHSLSSESDTKYGIHDTLRLYENSFEFQEPRKMYNCDRCPYTNVRRDHLLSHLKFHMLQSELQCPYCDYSVSKVHLLNQHIKVHFNSDSGNHSAADREKILQAKTEDLVPVIKDKEKFELTRYLQLAHKPKPKPQNASDGQENGEVAMETDNPDSEGVSNTNCTNDDENKNKSVANPESTCLPEDLSVAKDKTKGVVAAKSLWVCQYCDRSFTASEAMLRHENQHLMGNLFL